MSHRATTHPGLELDRGQGKPGRRVTPEMHDLVARLTMQGADTATILQALEGGYAAGRFPFVPRRETVSRLANRIRRHFATFGVTRVGAAAAAAGAGGARTDEAKTGRLPQALTVAGVRAALAATLRQGQGGAWPDAETLRWWAELLAIAPDLPPEDLPDLAAVWRAREAEDRPVQDLVLFVACAPWRSWQAFDDYVRAAAGAGEHLYPQWWGFLPTAARWLDEVVGDLSQIVAVLATGGPVLGPYDRAVDEREWQCYARDRWAAARASLVPLLPLVWRGLVSAAPPGDAPDVGAGAGAGVEAATAIPADEGGPVTENWFWRQTRRSDVLLAPPLTARTPVGRAWRWRSAAPATWTPLGPHEPVRVVILSICFDLARAVAALDQWAADGFPPVPMWKREPGPAQEPEPESNVDLFALRTRMAPLAGLITLRALPDREWGERALALLDPDEKTTPIRLRHGIAATSSATPPTGVDGGLGDERGRECER